MPIDFTKLPKPDPAESEGWLTKGFRGLNTPIVKLLGLQDSLEQKTAPTKADADKQAKVPQDEGLTHLAYRLLTGQGTPAEYKGAVAGGTEAVTPALAAQAASLGSGTPAAVANGVIAAQGAKDATDSSLPAWKRIMGGVGALTGGAGAVAGGLRVANARQASQALGDVSTTNKAVTGSLLDQQLASLKNDVANGTAFSDNYLKENYPELHAETVKNPGSSKYAQPIFGAKGRPAPQSLAESSELAQATRAADIKNTDKEFQRNIKWRNDHLDAVQKDIEKAGTQEDKNWKAGQKFITNAGTQDTRNEKAIKNFEVVAQRAQEKEGAARAADIKAETKFNVNQAKSAEAAGTQNAKMDDAAIAQADADRQANAIEGLKDRLTEVREPSTIRETVSGPGENGGTARATFLRTEPPPPEEEAPFTTSTGGRPANAQTKAPTGPATNKGFQNAQSAQKAADAAGGAYSVEQNPNDGLHYLIPEGKTAPWTSPDEDAVTQSVRPWSQISIKEKKALRQLLLQARDAGVPKERLEQLGDQLADKLSMIKEGRASAEDSNATLDAAIRQVKSSGAPIEDNGSEEIGQLKQFLKQNGISTRGVVAKTGKVRSLDQVGEDLKGILPGFENGKESSILDHLQSLGAETKQTPVEELISKHQGNWWEGPKAEIHDYTEGDIPTLDVEPPVGGTKAPESPISEAAEPEGPADESFNPAELEGQAPEVKPEPTMSVEDFAKEIPQESAKPIVPLPQQTLKLDGGQAPAHFAEPQPSLLDQVEPQVPPPPASPQVEPNFDVNKVDNPDGTSTFTPVPRAVQPPVEPQPPVQDAGAIAQGGVPAPEAPQAPSVPEEPIVPQGGAAPVRYFKSQLDAAGPHYQETQAAFKAGEAPNDAARLAGRAAQRIKKESLPAQAPQASPVAEAPAIDPEKAAQIQMTQQEIADPKTDDLTRQMLQRWLSEHGAAQAMPAIRTGMGLAGAATGYATDPLGNRPASALAGGAAGFAGPELVSAAANMGIPALAKGASTAAPYMERGLDFLNRFHNSGLLSPASVMKKAAGDVGGLTLAGIENPKRIPDMLRQFTTPEGRALIGQNFREGFSAPSAGSEDLSGLENFFQGITPPNATPLQKVAALPGKVMSLSGKTMQGLTKATKGIMGEAGFSVPEQQYYTLTAYPEHTPTKKLYEALRGGTTTDALGNTQERGSKLLSHLSPFARIGVNRLERGWEYSPFGLLSSKIKDPEAAKSIVTKALLGTGAAGAAYNFTPDDYVQNHPVAASAIASLGGPLGIPLLAGMALKNSKDSEGAVDWMKNMGKASQVIGRDVPGLRLLEDVTGRSFPLGFARNYLSGYTNFMRPIATAMDPEQPDTSSPDLPLSGQIFNQMLSNVPVVRGNLPRK